jgi:hypothetical protein
VVGATPPPHTPNATKLPQIDATRLLLSRCAQAPINRPRKPRDGSRRRRRGARACELRVACVPHRLGFARRRRSSDPAGLEESAGIGAVRAFGPSGLSGRQGFRAAAVSHSWTRGQADGRGGWGGWGGCTAACAESICTLTLPPPPLCALHASSPLSIALVCAAVCLFVFSCRSAHPPHPSFAFVAPCVARPHSHSSERVKPFDIRGLCAEPQALLDLRFHRRRNKRPPPHPTPPPYPAQAAACARAQKPARTRTHARTHMCDTHTRACKHSQASTPAHARKRSCGQLTQVYWTGEAAHFKGVVERIEGAAVFVKCAMGLTECPHLPRDCAHRCHICAETGLTPPTSAPEHGSPHPYLHPRVAYGMDPKRERARCDVRNGRDATCNGQDATCNGQDATRNAARCIAAATAQVRRRRRGVGDVFNREWPKGVGGRTPPPPAFRPPSHPWLRPLPALSPSPAPPRPALPPSLR